MCAHKIRHLEFLHPVRSPIQLLIRRQEQVQSADDCLNWRVGKFLPGKREGVDDSACPQPVITTNPSGVLSTSD
jgi:hypothetical protein